jgi:hypothetical protein
MRFAAIIERMFELGAADEPALGGDGRWLGGGYSPTARRGASPQSCSRR